MANENEQIELNNLYDRAISRYLDKNDFDFSEWLTEEEYLEYKRLYKIVFNANFDDGTEE